MLTPHNVEVTWNQSLLTDVTSYLISYTTTASYASGGSVMVDGIDNTSYTLTNLEEDTLYAITVQATTDDITGLVAYDDYSVMVAALNVNGTGPFSDPMVERSGDNSKWLTS